VQEIDHNVPEEENESKEQKLPEYMKVCAELSLNMNLTDGEIRDRCFHMLGGGSVFGVCIAELNDSFLVASAAQLVNENGIIDGRPFSRSKVIRLMRNGIGFISIPDPDHRYFYYRWLKKQYTGLPSFFSEDRRDIIDQFVYNYENRDTTIVKQDEDQMSNEKPFVESDNVKVSADSFWSPYTSTEFH
jgi:hypothetical protein